ncbi:hypothetical protein SynMVIR181_00208 [Synechococcus sp. MVIR-18-1]|nr:hypothetical protein SynMVIR181_00208 [Synechococcus sp. MVIR-18-1]
MINKNIICDLISSFDLNLDGLRIYTEAASGPYMYAPILAALAGAKSVTAQVSDSSYANATDIITQTYDLAKEFNVADSLTCINKRDYSKLASADIVTNSGHVRPIDRSLIDSLKPTAVIPLMWETWEFRETDFDLNRCHDRGILVLGTNEQSLQCDMRPHIALAGLKLLLSLGYDGGPLLILGNSPIPGKSLVDYLKRLNVEIYWVSDSSDADLDYSDFSNYFESFGSRYTHMLLAEHHNPVLLLGRGGLLEYSQVFERNPYLKIAVMAGNIEKEGLLASGLIYAPSEIAPFGFISYQLAELGCRPILTLYAAGLKVGELMARQRLSGLPIDTVVKSLISNDLVMDFQGAKSWLKN